MAVGIDHEWGTRRLSMLFSGIRLGELVELSAGNIRKEEGIP